MEWEGCVGEGDRGGVRGSGQRRGLGGERSAGGEQRKGAPRWDEDGWREGAESCYRGGEGAEAGRAEARLKRLQRERGGLELHLHISCAKKKNRSG
jgi:hypothetical protein